MSTEQLLDIVRRRGLAISLVDGRPVLKRPQGNKEVTAALLAVLTRHRDNIIRLLTTQKELFPPTDDGAKL